MKALAGGILDHIADGVPPSSIAVIADDRVMRERIRHALEEHGCRVEDFRKGRGERRIDIFDQSVKLLSIPSAKGIEFQVVYVPAVTEANFPSSGDDPEAADRARRALYTAMTRCTWELHLSATEKGFSALLIELGNSCAEIRWGLRTKARVARGNLVVVGSER